MGGFAIILNVVKQKRSMGLTFKNPITELKSNLQKNRLDVVETRLVDAQNKICIIRKDDTEFTLFVTPSSATLLNEEKLTDFVAQCAKTNKK